MSEPLSGLVVVDKPAGVTSHDVVARMRRIAGTRKVGHAGTLDPMATGVLLLGINKATRLLGHLLLATKAYDATIRLGAATNTDDADGEVTSVADAAAVAALAPERIEAALARMQGEIEQVPSTYSAIKVDGKRAYARARAGEEVTLAPRRVTVQALRTRQVRPGDGVVDVDVSVECSSGTYIRAIARDLGAALGVGGHLTALRRTRVGPFTLADAPLDLEEMATGGELNLVGLADAGRRFFPHLVLDDEQARDVGFGRPLSVELPARTGAVALIGPTGDLLALYEQRGDVAAPVAVLV